MPTQFSVWQQYLVCLVVGWNLIFNTKTKHPVRTLDAHYPRFTSFSSRSFPRLKKRSFPLAQKLVKLGRLLNRFPWQDASFSVFTQWNQVERTWDLVRDSGQRKLTYSSQNHCTSSRSVYLSRRLNSHWERFVITHHLQKWESQLRLRWRILSVHSYCSKPHIRIDIQLVNKLFQLRLIIRFPPD